MWCWIIVLLNVDNELQNAKMGSSEIIKAQESDKYPI